MTIQAVVFDIGGVLELTPDLDWAGAWESRLGLRPGELHERMADTGATARSARSPRMACARPPASASASTRRSWPG